MWEYDSKLPYMWEKFLKRGGSFEDFWTKFDTVVKNTLKHYPQESDRVKQYYCEKMFFTQEWSSMDDEPFPGQDPESSYEMQLHSTFREAIKAGIKGEHFWDTWTAAKAIHYGRDVNADERRFLQERWTWRKLFPREVKFTGKDPRPQETNNSNSTRPGEQNHQPISQQSKQAGINSNVDAPGHPYPITNRSQSSKPAKTQREQNSSATKVTEKKDKSAKPSDAKINRSNAATTTKPTKPTSNSSWFPAGIDSDSDADQPAFHVGPRDNDKHIQGSAYQVYPSQEENTIEYATFGHPGAGELARAWQKNYNAHLDSQPAPSTSRYHALGFEVTAFKPSAPSSGMTTPAAAAPKPYQSSSVGPVFGAPSFRRASTNVAAPVSHQSPVSPVFGAPSFRRASTNAAVPVPYQSLVGPVVGASLLRRESTDTATPTLYNPSAGPAFGVTSLRTSLQLAATPQSPHFVRDGRFFQSSAPTTHSPYIETPIVQEQRAREQFSPQYLPVASKPLLSNQQISPDMSHRVLRRISARIPPRPSISSQSSPRDSFRPISGTSFNSSENQDELRFYTIQKRSADTGSSSGEENVEFKKRKVSSVYGL